jgi:hypothetical protein
VPDVWDIVVSLREGKDDAKYRSDASLLARKIGRVLSSAKPGKMSAANGDVTSTYDLSEAQPGLHVAFTLLAPEHTSEQGGHLISKPGSDEVTLSINFKDDPTLRKNWRKHVQQHAAEIVSKNLDVFVHELIHIFDRGRMSPGAFSKQVKKASTGGAGYYNSPTELNAFMQQGMFKMVDLLKKVDSPQGRQLIMGRTPQEFYQKLTKKMDPNFVKQLTPDNKRKLAKRAYQLWGELVNQPPSHN